MPFHIGTPELVIVMVIVLVVFGVGRVGKIGGELGASIREFRAGLQADKPADQPKAPEPPVDLKP
jgi:sec-independent protein translocase protein TatA